MTKLNGTGRLTRTTQENNHVRYRLTDEEEQVLFNFREQKNLIEKECQQAGIDVNDVKHYWYKSKVFSMFVKQQGKSIEDLKEYPK